MGYWGSGAKRSYHHTAPVNALYALHEALLMLREEGLENAWNRHQHNHQRGCPVRQVQSGKHGGGDFDNDPASNGIQCDHAEHSAAFQFC